MKKSISIALIILSSLTLSIAQEYEYTVEEIYRSPLRKVLNQFSVTISTGYGITNYKHSLSGFYYVQSPLGQYLVDDNGTPLGEQFDGVSNWLNNPIITPDISNVNIFDVPYPTIDNPVNNPLLENRLLILRADSIGLEYSGKGKSIPLFLSLRYNFKDFRIGVGYQVERQTIKAFESNHPELGVRNYIPDFKSAFFSRYFLTLGYKFYDFWDYSFAGEIQIGRFKGKKLNTPFTSRGLNLNIGLSIEKNLSEYFRVFFKPSYDFNNYSVAIPGIPKSVKHKQLSWLFQVGISITFPEIPRSPIKSDRVQLKHVITHPETGRYTEVRGQPIHKIQNPKVGQNYRRMWRDKFKNRRKMNPY